MSAFSEVPYITIVDVSPTPADPKHEVCFFEQLGEAEQWTEWEPGKDVPIYVHRAEVKRLLESIVRMPAHEQQNLLDCFKE